jgi:hypothetical protein
MVNKDLPADDFEVVAEVSLPNSGSEVLLA